LSKAALGPIHRLPQKRAGDKKRSRCDKPPILLIWPHPKLLVLAIILGVWLMMFGILQIFIGVGIRAGAE
jgi:hypothetical protein